MDHWESNMVEGLDHQKHWCIGLFGLVVRSLNLWDVAITRFCEREHFIKINVSLAVCLQNLFSKKFWNHDGTSEEQINVKRAESLIYQEIKFFFLLNIRQAFVESFYFPFYNNRCATFLHIKIKWQEPFNQSWLYSAFEPQK